MATHLTIDESGRVAIPEALREKLHLKAGDTLEVESAGEEITLRRARDMAQVTKEQGVWVFRSGLPLSAAATDDMLERIRAERDLANFDQGE